MICRCAHQSLTHKHIATRAHIHTDTYTHAHRHEHMHIYMCTVSCVYSSSHSCHTLVDQLTTAYSFVEIHGNCENDILANFQNFIDLMTATSNSGKLPAIQLELQMPS